jgi:PAS domain S-box-containing protein
MTLTEPMVHAATRSGSQSDRLAALSVLGVLVAGVVLGTHVRVPYSMQLFVAYTTALTLSAAFAALLLVFRAHLIGDRASALLAAAFVFCVPLIAGYALTFPGVGPGILMRPDASGWMSFAWRLGLPVALTVYALLPPKPRGNLAATLGVALGASLGLIALSCSGLMPQLYAPGSLAFSPWIFYANGLMIVLSLVALASLLRKKPITTIDIWISVSLASLMTGSLLILFSHDRLSGTTDVVRAANIVSSFVLSCALIYEFQRLLARSSMMERFLTMAQYAANIVYLLDADGACIYVNRRWTSTTGQPADDALGSGWTAVLHPDDIAASAASWQKAIVERRTHEVELRYRLADGTYRWHLATATPTFDRDGNVDGWYGSAMDIDAQRRHADRLNELYAREHELAQTLQTAFIPSYLPQTEGLEFRAVYRPAFREAELGGDWYDAFVLPDGRVAISIGDVAGHGVDAAIAMVRLRETLRAATSFNDLDPAAVLVMCDHAFATAHPELIATALFALYEPTSRRLTFARAGHPTPVLVSGGIARFIDAPPGVPLGVAADSAFESRTVVLDPGDVLVFYTDGILEVDRTPVEGEERFLKLLASDADDVEAVVDAALGEGQRDDVAVLALTILESSGLTTWHFESDDASSAGDARFAFVAHLRRRALNADEVAAAELIFGELVSNVVRHAPGPIEVELIGRDNRLFLVVRDRGPHFMPAQIRLPDDPFAEGGRGLFIMARLGSTPVVVPRPGGGNEIVVALPAIAQVALAGEKEGVVEVR